MGTQAKPWDSPYPNHSKEIEDTMKNKTAFVHYHGNKYVDLINFDAKDVTFEGIAYTLSGINRFNGSTDKATITVGHHLLNCLTLARQWEYSPRLQNEILHHEDGEAFYGDIIGPLKAVMPPRVKQIFKDIDAKLREKFDVTNQFPRELKEIDNFSATIEATLGYGELKDEHWPQSQYLQVSKNDLSVLEDILTLTREEVIAELMKEFEALKPMKTTKDNTYASTYSLYTGASTTTTTDLGNFIYNPFGNG